jgi:acyl carrier protein
MAEMGLDSFTTVQLLIDLESTFEFAFPDEMLVAATFATPRSLWKALREVTGHHTARSVTEDTA